MPVTNKFGCPFNLVRKIFFCTCVICFMPDLCSLLSRATRPVSHCVCWSVSRSVNRTVGRSHFFLVCEWLLLPLPNSILPLPNSLLPLPNRPRQGQSCIRPCSFSKHPSQVKFRSSVQILRKLLVCKESTPSLQTNNFHKI